MPKQVFVMRVAESVGPRDTTRTSTFQVSEDIVAIAELKAHLSESVRSLEQRGRPLVVTLNGKPAAVVMSPRAYDRVSHQLRVGAKIEAGIADGDAGRVVTDDELTRRMAKRYGRPRRSPRKRS
jgi:prevent-host-death family protein